VEGCDRLLGLQKLLDDAYEKITDFMYYV
jgi:hypothetical protein